MASLLAAEGSSLCVVSKTWAKDRGDLFDFEADPWAESSDIRQQAFLVSSSASCLRSGTTVSVVPQGGAAVEDSPELLARFVRQAGVLWIDRAPDAATSSMRPSLVVKDLPGGSHELCGGEVIRLGCARIRVRQVVLAGDDAVKPHLRLEGEGPPCWANPGPEEVLADKVCRICMTEGPNDNDPLISPCGCKGSVEYVHLGCLREWIRVRCKLPAPGEKAYSSLIPTVKCDICRGPYAGYVRWSEATCEPLVEAPPMQPPFMVLEVRSRQGGASSRQMHVLSLAGEKLLKLGRAHTCDLRIVDASISRWHATLVHHDGRIMLEDHMSKFGTSVETQFPIPLTPHTSVSVQVGRTVLQVSQAARDGAGAGVAAPAAGEPGARDGAGC